jgi:hypothetical protein
VDEFLTLIIFFIVIGVVERVLKAAQKAKGERPTQRQTQPRDEGAIEGLPASLQDLIAEELGINLERKPRIEGPPEPAPPATTRAAPAAHPGRGAPPSAHPGRGAPPSAHPGRGAPPSEHPSRGQPPAVHPAQSAPPVPVSRERLVHYPGARREEPERGRERAGDRGAAITRARREVAAQRRRGPALVRRPLREPEQTPSLEERAMLERGEAVSLEQPRRPEDHKRFHDLYMVEEAGPGVRRRRGPLPDRSDWSAAQKAIIWAEILGPPKGLGD